MIEVKNLTRRYGDKLAVDNISFTIEQGHIYGFLGPNGAGKSTTMNIITGCLAATSGTVTVGGFDIVQKPLAAKKLIGYLPEIPPLYTDMKVKEYLTFVGRAKGLKKAALTEGVQSVMQKTGTEDVAGRLIKNLSKGYRQRVGIAQAILGDPQVIILDEPTVGLDPSQIIEIRTLIKSLKENHTVILSSHILSEISEICDEIIIINSGKIVACSTAEQLSADFNRGTVFELVVGGDAETAANALAELEEITKIEVDAAEGSDEVRLFVHCESAEGMRQKMAGALMGCAIPVLSMNESKAGLEDIYLNITSAADNGEFPAAADDSSESDEADETDETDDSGKADDTDGNGGDSNDDNGEEASY